MEEIKSIKTKLSKIYHPILDCFFNSDSVLDSIDLVEGNVICSFYEPAGSSIIKEMQHQIETLLFELDWVKSIEIKIKLMNHETKKINEGLDLVKNIIAVSSCKGGVGKSTIALNLAATLAENGAQVGLFDADIHGPSLPTLIQPTDIGSTIDENQLPPFLSNGIKLMSYGYIQEQANQPAILRGPIASNLLKQLLFKTDWGYLDYLIIDCPPGTGDILLTITQDIQLSSAIIVTSPHPLAYVDVQKGIEMFRKVNVPITSIVENMSYFICNNCDEKHYLYGSGQLQNFAKKNNISNWFELPVNKILANYNNKNVPFIMNTTNEDDTKKRFNKLANSTIWNIVKSTLIPDILIKDNKQKKSICITVAEKEFEIEYKKLRNECKCAYCVDEMTGKKILDINLISKDLEIETNFLVGHYAQGITWKENGTTHSSMYTNEFLKTYILEEGQ